MICHPKIAIFFKGQFSQVQVHKISSIPKVNPEVCMLPAAVLSYYLWSWQPGCRAALSERIYVCRGSSNRDLLSQPPIIEAAKISTRLHPQ